MRRKTIRQQTTTILSSLLSDRFLANGKEHGSEQLRLTTFYQPSPRRLEGAHDLERPPRQQTEKLHDPHDRVGDEHPAPGSPPDCEHVPSGLGLPDVALKRVIPLHLVRSLRQILLVLNVKTDRPEGFLGIRQGTHLGDTVAELEFVSKSLVSWD